MSTPRSALSRTLLAIAGLSALAATETYCGNSSNNTANPEAGTTEGDGGQASPDATTSSNQDASGGGNLDGGTSPSGEGGDGSTAASASPNILFFLTDDLSLDLVAHMPSVQAMQAQGITFDHYFVTESLCCPSRSSIFTGKYPHNTGVYANSGPQGGYQAFMDGGNQFSTFATTLKARGYTGQLMGKYLNGYDPQSDPAGPGWSQWGGVGDGYPEYNYYMNRNGTVVFYGDAGSDYLTDVLHGMASAFVQPSSAPFALEVATFAPHAPYIPAPQDIGTYDAGLPPNPSFNVRNINAPGWLAVHVPLDDAEIATLDHDYNLRVEAVQAVDRMISDLRSQLASTGLDKNTYVIFSSDNGYHMGQHTLPAGKQTAFDTDINVPLIVVGPGVPAGVVDHHVVENIDLCPTFAELAGAPALSTADGQSLVALLRGQAVTDWRNVVLVEHKGGTMDPADPDNEQTVDAGPGSGPDPTSYEAIRMVGSPDAGPADSVFVSYVDGEIEYYDITSDPYEMDNTVSALDGGVEGGTVGYFQGVVSAIQACKGTTACWAAQHM
jgi:N-acetylglucosamine-6-sulfatase